MAIVCRKCKYKTSKQEINQHYYGFLLNLVNNSINFVNNLFSLCRKAKIKDDSEVEEENTLLGRANQYEIRCPRCFKYNGWIVK